MRVQHRRDGVHLGSRVIRHQLHGGCRVRAVARAIVWMGRQPFVCLRRDRHTARRQIRSIGGTAFALRPLDERGQHLIKFLLHLLPQLAQFGVWRSCQFGQGILERPPVAIQPDIRQRRHRQQAPQQVKCPCPRRAPVRTRGGLFVARVVLLHPRQHVGQQAGIGRKQPIHRLHIASGVRRSHNRRLAVILVASRYLLVEGHIARRFFERRQPDAAVLQDLRRHIADRLARDMRPAQFCHTIITVANQHALIECLGTLRGGGHVVGGGSRVCQRSQPRRVILQKLVYQHVPQALAAAAVARKQCPLDHFGQVPQREHMPRGIGHKWRNGGNLRGGQRFIDGGDLFLHGSAFFPPWYLWFCSDL